MAMFVEKQSVDPLSIPSSQMATGWARERLGVAVHASYVSSRRGRVASVSKTLARSKPAKIGGVDCERRAIQ